jgi:hypothetical protein
MKFIRPFLFMVVLVLALKEAGAQVYTTQTASISFFSEARLENIEAVSKSGGVVLNTATNEVLAKVSITTFEFKNGLMQEHFNENYMESAKYPTAQFSGKIIEKINYSMPGTYPVTVTGTLTMHGVTVSRIISGTLIIKQGSIGLTSNFIVPVAEHKIHIPNDKISNIAQNIKVSIQADCTPYVKK